MLFASGIASMGVITDSTAVVIGAMLVAPLMNPIMGMGYALTMGWPRRLATSGLIVLLGVGIAISVSVLLSASVNLSVDIASNTQITSRSQPTTADLVIAIIAGGAGAYARSRKSVAASMPGVAIALVPPLTVVGITLQHGALPAAAGTMLLFLTNFVAILLVGGLVFLLTGVAPINAVADNQHRVRTALAAVAVLAGLVVGGLAINGSAITRSSLTTDQVRNAVIEWLGDDSAFALVSVQTVDDQVTLVLAGPGTPPPTMALQRAIAQSTDRPLTIDLQWIAREQDSFAVNPSG
ncbi:MAG: DUF389 domain-containing protein [Beutenbergiaceae bacterium]